MSEIPGTREGHKELSRGGGLVATDDVLTPQIVARQKPLGSAAMHSIGQALLNAGTGFSAGMATKLATDVMGRELGRLGTAPLASLSAPAWTSLISTEEDVASVARESVEATLTSVRSDLASAELATARSLQGASAASTIAVDTLKLGLASLRQSLMDAVMIPSPLDALGDTALTAVGATVTELSTMRALWDDIPDIGSSVMRGVGCFLAGPFDLVPSIAETINLAALPLTDYQHLLPPPGSLYADFELLDDREADPDDRLAAVRRMADRMKWYPRKQAVRRALADQAAAEETSVAQIRHRELCAAVLLVLDQQHRPQTHRVGKDWITGDDGRKAAVALIQLSMDLFWTWLYREVPKAAEASLLGLPYPPANNDPMDLVKDGVRLCLSLEAGSHEPAVPDGDPLVALLEAERRAEHWARLLPALQVATPRQIQLLGLLGSGLSEAEAARRLKIKPGTARSQLGRLRRRVM
jgi:DNA-binding CsgD family transcriptional regulator